MGWRKLIPGSFGQTQQLDGLQRGGPGLNRGIEQQAGIGMHADIGNPPALFNDLIQRQHRIDAAWIRLRELCKQQRGLDRACWFPVA